MRIRIALSTAIAVLVIPSLVIPSLLFMSFSSTGAGAARAHHGRHEAGTRHRAAKTESKPASHSRAHEAAQTQLAKAQKAAELASYYEAVNKANFYNAVTKQQEETYLKEYAYLKGLAYLRASAYLKALAAQQAAAAAQQAKAQQAAVAPAAPAAPAAQAAAPLTAGGSDATSTATPDWACIREHESNDNYGVAGGGAYQFELGTWEGLTGLSTPAEDSPPAVQDAAALRLYAESGWAPWTTRFVCGL